MLPPKKKRHIMDDYYAHPRLDGEIGAWSTSTVHYPLNFSAPGKEGPSGNGAGRGGRTEAAESELGAAIRSTPKLADLLRSAIFEQEDAVAAVVAANHRIEAGLTSPEKPLTSLLFLGPTGCGKTEVARLWAANLGWPLIRYDMSEFSEPHNVSSLLGSPPGYVGSEQRSRILEVNQHQNCVILLDEIEKADREVQLLFLQALDNGTITDRAGRKIDFRKSIIIMTTNALAGQPARLGFGADAASTNLADSSDGRPTTRDLTRDFPPEFLGRIKAVVPFRPLTEAGMTRVLEKAMKEVNALPGLVQRSLRLTISKPASRRIVELALRDGLGARPVASRLDTEVVGLVAQEIAEGTLKLIFDKTVAVDYSEGQFSLKALSKDLDVSGASSTGEAQTAELNLAALPVETGESLASLASRFTMPFAVEKTSYTPANIALMRTGQDGFLPLGTILAVTGLDPERGDFYVVAVTPDRRVIRSYLRNYSRQCVFTLKAPTPTTT